MANYVHPEALVDTAWVAAHGNDPNVRLIEIDSTPQAYTSGHIAGAQFWNGAATMLLPNRRLNEDKAAFEALMGRMGIANDTTIVLYSNGLATAGWAFWFLKLFGHTDVRLLNGGRKKWLLENRPLTTDVPPITPTTYRAKEANARLRALRHEVEAALGTAEVLLDVRTTQEYTGEWFASKPPVDGERSGHLPGATHIFYERNLNPDGTFKSYDELKAMYEAEGVTRDKVVTTY
jgi:thiosulfate/3-mercaptopyruvate sulfurtransferase